jgi:DNA ligase 1
MHRLAATLDVVRATRSRIEKVRALSEFFRTVSDTEAGIAARLIVAQPLPLAGRATLGVGWALLFDAVTDVVGQAQAARARHASRQAGDLGDGLVEVWAPASGVLSLTDLARSLIAVSQAEGREAKQQLLGSLLRACGPREVRYLVKAMLGEMRVGVQRGLLEEALASAVDVPLAELRQAAALMPDIGLVAEAAKRGTLAQATIVVGTPIAFMLATPSESVKDPIDAVHTTIEDKLDGIRAQLHHAASGQVRLFARGFGEVTDSFPEIVEVHASRLTAPVILDGEVLAVTAEGLSRPFQALQSRLGRIAPGARARAEVPCEFVAYDLLYCEESLLALPLAQRRARMLTLPVRANEVRRFNNDTHLDAQIEAEFAAARLRGNEGLMLKDERAPYSAGSRGAQWRKVKRALATLDVVVTRAEFGHGKRARVLSDYTFGVWGGGQVVEIGKAFTGLTDAEIADLTPRLKAMATHFDGRHYFVPPSLVIEVAFDGLQPSDRHGGGFALRFPRIVRLRPDKGAPDADTLDTVRQLFEQQVASGHREVRGQLELF